MTTTTLNQTGHGLRNVSGAELESVDGGFGVLAAFAAMALADQMTHGDVFKPITKVIQEYKDSKGGQK